MENIVKEMDKLILIKKSWEKDFKRDLLEDVLQNVEDLKEWVNDYCLIIESDYEITMKDLKVATLYKFYKEKLLSLDLNELQKEYAIIKGVYGYALEAQEGREEELNIKGAIEDINEFIKEYEKDEGKDLSLEEIKSIMDDIVYYGV